MAETLIEEQDEIELMGLLIVLWRRKWIIIGLVTLTMLTAALFVSTQPKEVRTELNVEFLWDGVEKGVYPDGSIFTGSDMIAPRLLSQLDTGNKLSGYLFVKDVIPESVETKLAKDSAFVFHSTKFKIILMEDKNLQFDSDLEREAALTGVVDNFIKMVKKKYVENSQFVLKFDDDFIEANEYDDIIRVLRTYIESLESSLTQKKESILVEFGPQFSSILNRLFVLKSVDLSNLLSEINNRYIAKDTLKTITRLSDEIRRHEHEAMKNKKMAEKSLDLLKNIKLATYSGKNEGQKAAVKPEMQYEINSSVIDQLRENDYVFYLIKLNLDAETKVIDNNYQIKKLQALIQRVKDNEKNLKADHEYITEELRGVQRKLLMIFEDVNRLNVNWIEAKSNKGLRRGTPEHIVEFQYQPKLVLVLAFVGSLLLGVFLSFFVDYIISYRKKS